MGNRAIITMVSGKSYTVNLNASYHDLQAIVDEIHSGEFFELKRAGQRPKLLCTANIEDIDLI